MNTRKITPGYIVFYILFSQDTWQIVMGVLCAALLGPVLAKPHMSVMAKVVLYIMIATIGYAVSTVPARWISGSLKKLILGNRRP